MEFVAYATIGAICREKTLMGCTLDQPLDPRVRRTRKLLQDALRELLHESRFESISVQDIAERATVNRATFYAHYPDKESLLSSLIRADFHAFTKSRFESFPELNRDGLLRMGTAIVEFVGGLGGGCPAAAKELGCTLDRALQEEIYEMFRHWLEIGKSGRFEGHRPDTVATTLTWSFYGVASRWSQGERKRTPEAVAKGVVNLIWSEADSH